MFRGTLTVTIYTDYLSPGHITTAVFASNDEDSLSGYSREDILEDFGGYPLDNVWENIHYLDWENIHYFGFPLRVDVPITKILRKKVEPGEYSLFSNNCSHYASRVLALHGVPPPYDGHSMWPKYTFAHACQYALQQLEKERQFILEERENNFLKIIKDYQKISSLNFNKNFKLESDIKLESDEKLESDVKLEPDVFKRNSKLIFEVREYELEENYRLYLVEELQNEREQIIIKIKLLQLRTEIYSTDYFKLDQRLQKINKILAKYKKKKNEDRKEDAEQIKTKLLQLKEIVSPELKTEISSTDFIDCSRLDQRLRKINKTLSKYKEKKNEDDEKKQIAWDVDSILASELIKLILNEIDRLEKIKKSYDSPWDVRSLKKIDRELEILRWVIQTNRPMALFYRLTIASKEIKGPSRQAAVVVSCLNKVNEHFRQISIIPSEAQCLARNSEKLIDYFVETNNIKMSLISRLNLKITLFQTRTSEEKKPDKLTGEQKVQVDAAKKASFFLVEQELRAANKFAYHSDRIINRSIDTSPLEYFQIMKSLEFYSADQARAVTLLSYFIIAEQNKFNLFQNSANLKYARYLKSMILRSPTESVINSIHYSIDNINKEQQDMKKDKEKTQQPLEIKKGEKKTQQPLEIKKDKEKTQQPLEIKKGEEKTQQPLEIKKDEEKTQHPLEIKKDKEKKQQPLEIKRDEEKTQQAFMKKVRKMQPWYVRYHLYRSSFMELMDNLSTESKPSAIAAKPVNPDAATLSESGFGKLSPEKPINNAGPVTFSAEIAAQPQFAFLPSAVKTEDPPLDSEKVISPLRTRLSLDQPSITPSPPSSPQGRTSQPNFSTFFAGEVKDQSAGGSSPSLKSRSLLAHTVLTPH
jgi:hypothetical protein